jgi:DNA-binding NarL/FixJ family response regulator
MSTRYKQGFTMEAIATQLDVSHTTIERDLKEFAHDVQIKPVKTTSNPKGAGRPKGSKKPKHVAEKHEKIVGLADAGLPKKDIAAETGVGERMVDRVLEVDLKDRYG